MKNNNSQKMALLSRNKEKQCLDQCYDIDTLLQLISTIESVFIKDGNKINRQFGFYDKTNSHEKYSLQERVGQAKNQLKIFKMVYLIDIKEYGSFKFPSNMDKNLIIDYLKKYRQCKYLTQICDELIDLLLKNKDTNPKIVRNDFKNCNNNSNNNINPFGHIEWPYDTLGNLVPAIKNGQQYMEQDVRDQLTNTGEYNFKVKFGGNTGENVVYKNYHYNQNDHGISPPPLTGNDSDMNFC